MMTLFFNGDVLTMENENDCPEAVLIDEDHIVATGSYDDLLALAGAHCQLVDLMGHTLMPSFIDGHGHIVMASVQYGTKVDLEGTSNFDEIVERLQAFIADHQIPAGQPVAGYAYDHNFLEEGTHPDKHVLDRASKVHPIVIAHTSGHVGCANSLALSRAGISAATPNPQGGFIARYPDSEEPTGYLEEAAIMMANAANEPPVDNPEALLEKVQDLYAANGVTTAQDGATASDVLAFLKEANAHGKLKIDIVAYPMPMELDGDLTQSSDGVSSLLASNAEMVGTYKNHLKIGGYKILLDGSPQGRTAWMCAPYEGSDDYCGYPWLTDDQVHAYIKRALNDNQQLLTHCNGDAASQQLLDIYEEELAASTNPNKNNLRPVMIHCQTVRDDQLDRMKNLGMIPSIFVAHTYYWGDVHLKNFGPVRGSRVSPARSALERGLPYNFHTDTPVRLPLMLHSVWCAVNRRTVSGASIGPEQCIDVYDALKGITINAAYAYFEEDSKGSIKAGKRADLVVLDRNPLKVDKNDLCHINVLETIKDGKTIFKR